MTQVIQSLINVLNSPIAQRQGIILSPEHCREWADALSEALRSGVGLIAEERQRQIEKGFTQEHDANHEVCEYVVAANCYSVAANVSYSTEFFRTEEEKLILESIRREWPWDKESFKPTTSKRNLVKAGALIAAAIDRLQNETEGTNNESGRNS